MIRKTASHFLALVLLAIAGCASQTEVVKLHDDRSVRSAPYARILVVGIAINTDERRKLEDLLARDLVAAGTDATAAYTMVGLTPSVLQQDIDAAAAEIDAPAILITHIVSVDKDIEFQKGRTEILSECRGGDPAGYFLYDHKELKLPDSIQIAHTVVAVTSLYDTANSARTWTIQSTCFDMKSMDEVLREESRAIVRQLRIDKLIS